MWYRCGCASPTRHMIPKDTQDSVFTKVIPLLRQTETGVARQWGALSCQIFCILYVYGAIPTLWPGTHGESLTPVQRRLAQVPASNAILCGADCDSVEWPGHRGARKGVPSAGQRA